MRQNPGELKTVPIITAVPVGTGASGEGLDMSLFIGASKPAKHALYAQLTGGTSCELWLYVRRAKDDLWSLVADVGNLGKLGGGLLTPGNYIFLVENIGVFDQIVVRKQNDTGGVTVACQLEEYIENNFQRGD